MKTDSLSDSRYEVYRSALLTRDVLLAILRRIQREHAKRNSEFLKTLAEFQFVPGETYSNRLRRYTVLAIREPKLIVRYEDDTVDELTTEIQRRIITNMKLERGPENHSPTSSTSER